MTTTQQLVLQRIAAAIAADDRLTLIHDPQYANTGTLRTLDYDTLAHVASVTYDFQQDACRFGTFPAVAYHHYTRPHTGSQAAWVCGSIPDLVTRVVTHLKGTS